MGGSSTTLSIVIKAIDDASAQLAGVFNGIESKATTAQQTLTELGTQLTVAGAAMTGIGVKITDAMDGIIQTGEKQKTAQDQLANTIQNQINLANRSASADSGLATEKQFLTNKIDGLKASLEKADAVHETATQLAKDHGAAMTVATASAAKLEQAIAQYQGKLDLLNASQSMAGQTAATITSQFDNTANSVISLGFAYSDSLDALDSLQKVTGNVGETMTAFQAAMDLSRLPGHMMPLADAAKQVDLALQGQGRTLATLGIQIKDGLTPMESLAALQEKVAGNAKIFAEDNPMAVQQAEWDKLMGDLGVSVIPMLDKVITTINSLVQQFDAWAEAHPKLAQAVMIGVGVFGVLMLTLGSLMLVIGPLLIAFGTMGGVIALFAFGESAAIAAFAAYVLTHWDDIKTGTQVLMQFVQTTWTNGWNAVVSVFDGIASKIYSIVNGIVAAISRVTSGISSIGASVGSSVSNFGSSMLNMVPHFASGGIVTSPTMALVGEAGPEAIIPLSAFNGGGLAGRGGGGGSSGNIVVNINGGNYLDSNGATMIANAIGKQIVRQLKVSNFN
jgi:hypothetical protein